MSTDEALAAIIMDRMSNPAEAGPVRNRGTSGDSSDSTPSRNVDGDKAAARGLLQHLFSQRAAHKVHKGFGTSRSSQSFE